MKIFKFESVPSTNDFAKEHLSDFDEFAVVSKMQTRGKGRCGKSFYSPKDSGLYFSYAFHPDSDLKDFAYVTTLSAVAVFLAIKKICGIETKIKWVNDIYLDGKKICGILAEADTDFEKNVIRGLVIGIGINLTTSDFPEDVKLKAGSLGDFRKESLMNEILSLLKKILNSPNKNEYMKIYKENSNVIGQNITFIVNGKPYAARALDITDTGGLVVQTENSDIKILTSGEISIKL